MGFLDAIFGKTGDTQNLYKSNEVNQALGGMATNRLPQYQQRFDTGLGNLEQAAQQAYGNLQGLAPQNIAALQQSMGRISGFDPFAAETARRQAQLGELRGLGNILSGAGRAQQNMAQARLGYAGVPTSSYQSLMDSSRAAAALAPIANQIYGNSASGTAQLGNMIYNQPGALNQAILAQEGVYGRPVQLMGMPLAAAQGALGAETGALGQLSSAAAQNFGGFEQPYKKGFLDYANQFTGSIGKQVGDLAGAAGQIGSVFGTGGLGGMLGGFGGLFGGGGGRQNRPQSYVQGSSGPVPSYYDQFA